MGVTAALGRRIGTAWLKRSVGCEGQSYQAVLCPIELCVDVVPGSGSFPALPPAPRFGPSGSGGPREGRVWMGGAVAPHRHVCRSLIAIISTQFLTHTVSCGGRARGVLLPPGEVLWYACALFDTSSQPALFTWLLQGVLLSIQTLVAFCV